MDISTNDWVFFILKNDWLTQVDSFIYKNIMESYGKSEIINWNVEYTFSDIELYDISKKESVIFELNNKRLHKHLVFNFIEQWLS